ncbi:MAG TPA: hypothetical protein VND68_13375 [Chloroflexia bacterium]|nr:hypothetical protein [Chloroflexia bacterium]
MVAVALLLLVAAPLSPRNVAAQEDCQAFAETSRSVCGKFLAYWKEHGGLEQQGFPISQPFQEKSDVDGKTYTVQYFERAVFEDHPELAPPHDILLSLLGSIYYDRKYPTGAPGQKPNESPGSVLFAGTSKRLGGRFLEYWSAHGGLAQQGYPISNEFEEKSELDGNTYTVQYFERAVFEYHPEKQAPYDVLLSQLGTLQYARKYAASPTPGPDAWSELRGRPLSLPHVEPGAACPVTPRQPRASRPPSAQNYYVLGNGPIYPNVTAFGEDTSLKLKPDMLRANGWYVEKVPWLNDSSYVGPVLIRVRQLDGISEARVDMGNAGPKPDVALDAAAPGYFWPGATYVRGPGCYAYQVDGNGFSYVLVFKAVLDNAPATPSPAPDAYAELRQRPLKTQPLASGEACPTSKSRSDVRPGMYVFGSGPVYLQRVPTASDVDGEIGLTPSMYVQHRDAYSIKGPWLSEPEYPGPTLIRGHQLNGDGVIRFDYDQGSFSTEMAHGDSNSRGADAGWSGWASAIWLPGAGCYALQIDGLHFTEVIVLKAVQL